MSSKWELAGLEMAERLVISDDMTSGEAGGRPTPWAEDKPRSFRDGVVVEECW